MSSTYSAALRLELLGAGDQAGLWGNTTNKNLGTLLEQAIAGVTTIPLDSQSTTYTLTALNGTPDQARSAVLNLTYTSTPASAPFNMVIPTQPKVYTVANACGQTVTIKTSAQVGGVAIATGTTTLVFCDGTNALAGLASIPLGIPASGNLTNCTVDGTNPIGYKNIPQNSQTTSYGIVAADAGKHIYSPVSSSAHTVTIPANASVAFSIGTAITFVNDSSAGNVTIAITSDTLVFCPSGRLGSCTLAANGIATAIKVTATRWVISGTNLS